jgi:hypothetical protein
MTKMISTPWGPSQTAKQIAPGIVRVSTASHGGYVLNAERQAEFEKKFPDFKPYAGAPFYEEDQDAAMIALAFPEHFDDAAIYNAVRTVYGSAKMHDEMELSPQFKSGCGNCWNAVIDWLNRDPEGRRLAARADQFEAARAEMWEAGSMGGDGRTIHVSFTRVGDHKNQWLTVKEWPKKQFYNDEELAAMVVEPKPVKSQEAAYAL